MTFLNRGQRKLAIVLQPAIFTLFLLQSQQHSGYSSPLCYFNCLTTVKADKVLHVQQNTQTDDSNRSVWLSVCHFLVSSTKKTRQVYLLQQGARLIFLKSFFFFFTFKIKRHAFLSSIFYCCGG